MKLHDYMRVVQLTTSRGGALDYCLTSNFDERYERVLPVISRELLYYLSSHYPLIDYISLKEKIKERFKVKELVLGGGSEELIVRANRVLQTKDMKVGVVLPTFYRILETLEGRVARRISLRNLNSEVVDLDAVWIVNPNPLTGEVISRKDLTDIIERNPKTLFLVDEAAMFLLPKWRSYSFVGGKNILPNVVAFSSFSKIFGVSGLRAGFASGNARFLFKLETVGSTFPLSGITAYILERLLLEERFFEEVREKIQSNKVEVENLLKTIPNIEVFPSVTNCVFFRYTDGKGGYNKLLKMGIMGLGLDTQEGIGERGVVRLTIHSSEKLHGKLLSVLEKI